MLPTVERVGLDLHGVINRYPEGFKALAKLLRELGVRVFVITGPPTDIAEEELCQLGFSLNVHYDELISVVDWLISVKAEGMSQDDKGNWWTEERTWWSSKGRICKEFDIDILVDNSIEYKNNFPPDLNTSFVLIGD